MEKQRYKFLPMLLLVLVVLIILLWFSFYVQSYLYKPVGRFFSVHAHRTLGINNVGNIQGWMTFNYLNKVFNLPKDYLKNTLNITDPHYPNVSIEGYAKKEKINVSTFLLQVKNAVSANIASKQ